MKKPPLLALALGLFAYHSDLIVSGKSYYQWDMLYMFFPWRTFAGQALREGILPLWNPYQFCGTSFVGNLQAALLYPGTWLFGLLSFPAAALAHQLVHQALACWGTYRLARGLGLDRPSASLAGMTWAFSGAFAIRLPFINMTGSLAYLPWACLGGLNAARREVPGSILGLAWPLSLAFLAGQPREALFCFLGAAGFWLWGGRANRWKRPAWILTAGLGLALLIIQGQFLPFVDHLSRSVRGSGLTRAQADAGGWTWHHAQHLARPFSIWNPDVSGAERPVQTWSGFGYIGLWGLLLALGGLAALPSRTRTMLLVLGTGSFFLIFGSGHFPWIWIQHLPGIRLLRYPETLSVVLALGLALLAGKGWTAWRGRLFPLRSSPAGELLRLGGLAGLALFLTQSPLDPSMAPGWAAQGRRLLALALMGGMGPPGAALAQAIDLADLRRTIAPSAPDSLFGGQMLEAKAASALAGTERIYLTHQAEQAMAGHRLAVPDDARLAMRRLYPNMSMVWGLRSVDGYDPLRPRRLSDFLDSLGPTEALPWEHPDFELLSASVGVVVPRDLEPGRPQVQLDRLRSGPMARISGDNLNPARVQRWTEDQWGRAVAGLEGVREVSSLFLSRSFDPGLRARAEGQRRAAGPGKLAFTSVDLRPGDREIKLTYEPDTFLAGFFLSCLGIAVAAGLCLWPPRSGTDRLGVSVPRSARAVLE